ncbi:class I SAM-dependent methyltransferase [Lentzea sp. NBRC 102530]|uniref:class I SAM-dependent methyltransferase n=1 Tax=Lentzea sp. NBRC 102530 TaxID=3032201 RepID=UPI0024A1DBE4|nr:class I SAM-dependent methyltransferase [Lentzea sp. NBRC 102530]GLY54948.1 SAM-dependent methyltransferase [Lentzea sp. NBRC 102530]
MRRIPLNLQLPEKLWWDHNAWYRRWLLRQLPSGARTALDVGCGHGVLARSIPVEEVTAIDASERMIEIASGTSSRVRWVCGDVFTADLGRFDVVTAEASLHHLPLRAGLERFRELTAPGGTLVVVGLYTIATPVDWAVEAVTLPANAVVGVAKAATGTAGKPYDVDMPVVMSAPTLNEIRGAAAEILPGARIRRRLFWRYSMVWHAPEVH